MPTLNATIQAVDINGQTLTIQLWGTSAVANITLKGAMPMAQMRYNFDDNEFWNSSFQFGELALQFYIDAAAAYTLVDNIVAARDGDFHIRVFKAGAFYWGGLIMPDSLRVDIDCPKPIVEIRAVDGIKFFANSKTHNDTLTFGEVLHNCITSLPWVEAMYVSEVDQPMIFYGLQFSVTGASAIPYYDIVFTGKFDNDYEYLQAVLKEMGQYLVQAKGVWYVVPLFLVASGSLSGTNIGFDNVAINSTTLTFSLTNTNKSSGGVYYFTRAFGKVTTNFSTNDRRNFKELTNSYTTPYPAISVLNAWSSTTPLIRNVGYFVNAQLFTTFLSNKLNIVSVQVEITQLDNTEWWNGSSWQGTLAYAHTQFLTGSAWAASNTVDWSFSGLLPYVSGIFNIKVTIEAENQDGGTVIKASTTVVLTTEDNSSGSGTLGTGVPEYVYQTESGNTNVLNLNVIKSESLGLTVGKLFNYAPYSNLEMWDLRLHLLKDFLAVPKRMMECETDNLTTPVQFYQVGEWKIIPLRMDFDLLREEGTILGWAIVKI